MWASPLIVDTSPQKEEGRRQIHAGGSTPISARERSGWSGGRASRSRRWPGTWGSTRARWGTGSTPTSAAPGPAGGALLDFDGPDAALGLVADAPDDGQVGGELQDHVLVVVEAAGKPQP